MDNEQPDWTFGKSPYLDTEEARVMLRKPSREAFVKWAHRHGVTLLHCGRRLLVDRRELERALQGPKRKPRRALLELVHARQSRR